MQSLYQIVQYFGVSHTDAVTWKKICMSGTYPLWLKRYCSQKFSC